MSIGDTKERVEASPHSAAGEQANLFGLDRRALEEIMAALGEPRYRGRQVFAWLYAKRVGTIGGMTDLAKPLRARLLEAYSLRWPDVAKRQLAGDGTVKYLLRLEDGAAIESVLIPEERRRTICLSTQVGCPLKCRFCLTGYAGFKRNLNAAEILGQAAVVLADDTAHNVPLNVVLMGMGEPLLNLDAALEAVRILTDKNGFAIPAKRLTLSTVGILPGIRRLLEEKVRPNLAISLHAPNGALRQALMPIEAKYPLKEVLAAVRDYPIPRGGAVTFEYVLLGGVNDSEAQARQLARLLSGQRAKVNLIPLNPAAEIPFKAPAPDVVDRFAQVLADADVRVSVRRARGQDISAACGQLHITQAGGISETPMPENPA
jgi:23S rRNA (adenine2503-C2)-methyltransferase